MTKSALEKSLTASAGGALVTIQDIMDWSGRSRDYLKKNILTDLESIQDGQSRFYFAGDVAQAIADKAKK